MSFELITKTIKIFKKIQFSLQSTNGFGKSTQTVLSVVYTKGQTRYFQKVLAVSIIRLNFIDT